MTFSIPTINNAIARIITIETTVAPGNTIAIIARIMAKAPRPIWAARLHPGDFCELISHGMVLGLNYLKLQ
jgi:hypothetical protein